MLGMGEEEDEPEGFPHGNCGNLTITEGYP